MFYLRSYLYQLNNNREMHRIKGRIQHYAWGGKTFIAELLSQKNEDDLPCGEYWLGVHPGGPNCCFG